MTKFFPFQGAATETDNLINIIEQGRLMGVSRKKRIEKEIGLFKSSTKRAEMLQGERYFEGQHDYLNNKRMVIGKDGELEENTKLPNNKRIDNQYEKLVNQKVNYLLAKPLTIETENDAYQKALNDVLNKRFHKQLRMLGEYTLNNGIAWIFPNYNSRGEFVFTVLPGYQVLPFYADSERTIVDYAIRLYTVEEWVKDELKMIEKVEIYTKEGIERYILENGSLIPDVEDGDIVPYITVKKGEKVTGANWERVPLIPFRYNNREIPLIRRVKSLQDGYNKLISMFENNMDEDGRSTILVIHNYDGQDLGEFRHNLSKYGAVKVRSGDGAKGGVDTLTVEVNKDNYESILTLLKKAIIENGKGYDAKDERMANNPNQMNIQSMYADIDLDANAIETEYQSSFEELLWFINRYIEHKGQGNFDNVPVELIFNRDMLINESEVIDNLNKSTDLSIETRIAQHPYIKDVQLELKRRKEEQQEQMNTIDNYGTTFKQKQGGEGGNE